MFKTCTKCWESKVAADSFYVTRRYPHLGVRYLDKCKACAARYGRENAGMKRAARRRREASMRVEAERGAVERLARYLHGNKKSQAKGKNLPYTLSPEWYAEKLRAGVCEATGLPLDVASVTGARIPSVDQIVPGAGYTPDNARLTCFAWNLGRRTWSDEELLEVWGAWVDRKRAEEAR